MNSLSNFVKITLITCCGMLREWFRSFLGSSKDVSRKVRRIPQNLGARSDETGRDRREVRRDMSEILARSAVSDRYLPLPNGHF